MYALAILVDPRVVQSRVIGEYLRLFNLEDWTYEELADIVGHDCWVQHSVMTP